MGGLWPKNVPFLGQKCLLARFLGGKGGKFPPFPPKPPKTSSWVRARPRVGPGENRAVATRQQAIWRLEDRRGPGPVRAESEENRPFFCGKMGDFYARSHTVREKPVRCDTAASHKTAQDRRGPAPVRAENVTETVHFSAKNERGAREVRTRTYAGPSASYGLLPCRNAQVSERVRAGPAPRA